MALKPYADARSSIGEGPVDIEDAREYMWVGNNTYLLHNVLNQGTLVQFVICSFDEDAVGSDQWHRMVGAEEIKKLYQDWPPHLNKAINEVCRLVNRTHSYSKSSCFPLRFILTLT